MTALALGSELPLRWSRLEGSRYRRGALGSHVLAFKGGARWASRPANGLGPFGPVAAMTVVATVLLFSSAPAWAGAWTTELGELWWKLSFLTLRSDEVFADSDDVTLLGCTGRIEAGTRRPYDCATGGTFAVDAVYLDVTYGVLSWLDIGLQVPIILSTSFENDSGLSGQSSGLGDLRFAVKARVLQYPSFVSSLRLELKAPTGTFDVDEAVPPLGEGQWDVTSQVEAGWGSALLYASGYVGFRFRAANPDTRIDVGDEFVGGLEAGIRPWRWFLASASWDLVLGFESQEAGFPAPRPRRWVTHLTPGILVAPWECLGLEAKLRWPLAGEGYPADPTLSLGLTGTLPLPRTQL